MKESPKIRATNKPPEPDTHSARHQQNVTLPAPGGGPPGPPRRWRASLFNIYFYFFHRVHLLSPSCDVLRFFCLQHHIMSRSTSTYVLQSTVFVIFFATNTFELVNWPMGSNLKRPCDIRLQIENGSWKIVCGAQRDTHQSGQRAKVRSFGGAQRRAQNRGILPEHAENIAYLLKHYRETASNFAIHPWCPSVLYNA